MKQMPEVLLVDDNIADAFLASEALTANGTKGAMRAQFVRTW